MLVSIYLYDSSVVHIGIVIQSHHTLSMMRQNITDFRFWSFYTQFNFSWICFSEVCKVTNI